MILRLTNLSINESIDFMEYSQFQKTFNSYEDINKFFTFPVLEWDKIAMPDFDVDSVSDQTYSIDGSIFENHIYSGMIIQFTWRAWSGEASNRLQKIMTAKNPFDPKPLKGELIDCEGNIKFAYFKIESFDVTKGEMTIESVGKNESRLWQTSENSKLAEYIEYPKIDNKINYIPNMLPNLLGYQDPTNYTFYVDYNLIGTPIITIKGVTGELTLKNNYTGEKITYNAMDASREYKWVCKDKQFFIDGKLTSLPSILNNFFSTQTGTVEYSLKINGTVLDSVFIKFEWKQYTNIGGCDEC